MVHARDRGQRWGIRAARLFDGKVMHRGMPLVVIQGDRIVGVDLSGTRPSVELPMVELGDVTLLPGLIDAHVHLAFDPCGDVAGHMQADDQATLMARIRRHALQALRAGITTVRDLGDRDYLALAVRDEYAATGATAPEILASGPPVTRTGGHCWFLGGEADEPAELRAAVVERAERGVDVIKVMATGGGITPGSAAHESQYNLDQLRVIVEAAHSVGKPVTAHAHGGAGIADAVRAGVDGIEHGTFLTADGAAADWATVQMMVEEGVYVGVTAGRLPHGAPLSSRVAAARALLPRMHREGVRLVCSSDAGVVAEKPHNCLPRGLGDFKAYAELSPAEVIASVTSLAAQSCGIGDRKGMIVAGYEADLLAVVGDPEKDLQALGAVSAVFRAGQRIPS